MSSPVCQIKECQFATVQGSMECMSRESERAPPILGIYHYFSDIDNYSRNANRMFLCQTGFAIKLSNWKIYNWEFT